MKRIIIVNDNLYLGGIQKALVNLLNEIHDKYDITLLLLNKQGELLDNVPGDVNIIEASKSISVLGAHKKELRNNITRYLWKGILILFAKVISKRFSFTIAGITQKKIGTYDVAISYSHPSKEHDLRSCSAEFVLKKIDAVSKICFVHGDYQNESIHSLYTDSVYKKYDKIACCSESVKNHFLDILPDLKKRVAVVRNFYDLSLQSNEGKKMYEYDESYINVVSIARLTAEKGIKRAIEALHESGRNDIRYYIVGDGPERNELEKEVERYRLEDLIFFMGESKYPYFYMKSSDYLLVPSFHEAAPLVFDEAKLLGLRIITTNTTSAMEMVGFEYGIVCENSVNGIRRVLSDLVKPGSYQKKDYNNSMQHKQFAEII